MDEDRAGFRHVSFRTLLTRVYYVQLAVSVIEPIITQARVRRVMDAMSSDIESVTENKYRNGLVQFDPSRLLELCNKLSVKLLQDRKSIIIEKWPTSVGSFRFDKTLAITHHKIALVAMIAVQNAKYSHARLPTEREFVALVNNVSTIRNPVDKLESQQPPENAREALYGMMVRLAYQQFPFQEHFHDMVPRHLLLYRYARVTTLDLNLDAECTQRFGVGIHEFLTVGLALFAASMAHAFFPRSFLENTQVAGLRKYLTAQNIDNVMNRISADFGLFRDLCMSEIEAFPDGGTYRFNPLFDRPIIRMRDGRYCAPVPLLVPHAVTKGLYYDFLDQFRGVDGNRFSDWFGYAFEWYGGVLLKCCFGKRNVFPEPVYGREHRRGPDWTAIKGDCALVLELRSGRLNKRAKVYGDYDDVGGLVRRNVVDPLTKLPQKLADIKDGLTAINVRPGTEFFPCVVTYEPLYSIEMFREIVDRELEEQHVAKYDYELFSIEDLEWLTAWAAIESPFDFLREKRNKPEWRNMAVRRVIEIKANQKGVALAGNGLLRKVFDKFWERTVPEYLAHDDQEERPLLKSE